MKETATVIPIDIDEIQVQEEALERERDLAAEWLAAEERRIKGGHGAPRTLTAEEIAALPINEAQQERLEQEAQERQRKAKSSKQRLKDGFYGYLATGNIDLLLERTREHIARRFTRIDWAHNTSGAEGRMQDVNDWTQDLLVDIWQQIDTFEGDSDDYERWLNRIVTNRRHDAFRELQKLQQTFVPASFDVEYEDGSGETFDHPEIVKMLMGVGRGYAFREYPIPDYIEGTDRWVCELILDGMDYAEVASETGFSTQAIKDRVYRLRQKLAPQYAERQEAKAARLAERDAAYNGQLAIRQRTRTWITAKSALNAAVGKDEK